MKFANKKYLVLAKAIEKGKIALPLRLSHKTGNENGKTGSDTMTLGSEDNYTHPIDFSTPDLSRSKKTNS